MTQELLSAHTAAITRAGEAAREHFEGAAGRRPHVESTWSALTAQNPHVLINHARRTDLVVVPRHIRPSRGLTSLDAAELALAAGGPVLVVPDGVASRSVGRRVLVAWNGSREAARALRDLWPLLPSDAELHVLVVSPKGQGGPDSGLQRHLEHHGRVANLIVDPSPDESAGLVLERQVAELDADLVVMGLYGRPRLQEVVLGGMSRHMLDRLPVPLLVSH
jgi:nucleotide-binding universal stress UspA family protein